MEWSSEIWPMATASTFLFMICFLLCMATAVPLIRFAGFKLKIRSMKNIPLAIDLLDQKIGGPPDFIYRTNQFKFEIEKQQQQHQQQQLYYQPEAIKIDGLYQPKMQLLPQPQQQHQYQQSPMPTLQQHNRKDKIPRIQSSYISSSPPSSTSQISPSSSSAIALSSSASSVNMVNSDVKSSKKYKQRYQHQQQQQRKKRSPRRHYR